jgi:hypothetical protein
VVRSTNSYLYIYLRGALLSSPPRRRGMGRARHLRHGRRRAPATPRSMVDRAQGGGPSLALFPFLVARFGSNLETRTRSIGLGFLRLPIRPRLPTSRLPTSRLTSLRSTSRLHTSRRSTNHRPISRLHTSRRSTSRRPISLRFPIHHRLPSQVRGSRIPLQAHLRHRVLFNEVRMQSHPDLLQIR